MVLTCNDRSKFNCKCIVSSLYLRFEVIILQRGETELVKSTFLYLPLHQQFCLEFFPHRFFSQSTYKCTHIVSKE